MHEAWHGHSDVAHVIIFGRVHLVAEAFLYPYMNVFGLGTSKGVRCGELRSWLQ